MWPAARRPPRENNLLCKWRTSCFFFFVSASSQKSLPGCRISAKLRCNFLEILCLPSTSVSASAPSHLHRWHRSTKGPCPGSWHRASSLGCSRSSGRCDLHGCRQNLAELPLLLDLARSAPAAAGQSGWDVKVAVAGVHEAPRLSAPALVSSCLRHVKPGTGRPQSDPQIFGDRPGF